MPPGGAFRYIHIVPRTMQTAKDRDRDAAEIRRYKQPVFPLPRRPLSLPGCHVVGSYNHRAEKGGQAVQVSLLLAIKYMDLRESVPHNLDKEKPSDCIFLLRAALYPPKIWSTNRGCPGPTITGQSEELK